MRRPGVSRGAWIGVAVAATGALLAVGTMIRSGRGVLLDGLFAVLVGWAGIGFLTGLLMVASRPLRRGPLRVGSLAVPAMLVVGFVLAEPGGVGHGGFLVAGVFIVAGLLAGAGLKYDFINERTVAIRRQSDRKTSRVEGVGEELRMARVEGNSAADADSAASTQSADQETSAKSVVEEGAGTKLEEIVVTATKRETSRWSLMASFANTWRREAALTAGAGYTPNAFINAEDEKLQSTVWQGKIHAILKLPLDMRVTPTLRHQSGSPFGGTFQQALNWGNANIRAEPINAQRMPNVPVFDVRTEKAVDTPAGRVTGFFDIYNIFNTNAEQDIATTSGSSYLRPAAITPPRIARLGIKFVF